MLGMAALPSSFFLPKFILQQFNVPNMKKIYLLFALLSSLAFANTQAQGCATLYPNNTYTLTVICTPGGVGSYGITTTMQGGINFTIAGLDAQNQSLVTASCSGSTFTFPNTPLPAGGSIAGGGTWTGTGPVNVAYGIYDGNGTLTDSCVGTFNVPVGIEDEQAPFTLELFPNPTQSNAKLNVQGLALGEQWAYEVYDLRGRLVMKDEAIESNGTFLSTETLEAGLYHVVVRSAGYVKVKGLMKH